MENINNANSNVKSAQNYLDKGNALYNQGDYESAISVYDKTITLNPNLAACLF